MKKALKRYFNKQEIKTDGSGLEAAELNDKDANSSEDNIASTSPLPKTTGSALPEVFKSAAEAAGAPCATPPAIYQTHVPKPQPMATAAAEVQSQATPSLPNPPRDHVAPKSYESVTIAVGRNCPPALRRDVWHVTDFDLRKLMYNGAISMVYHAVDKRSGITMALKLYKRIKLNEIERHQVAREIRLHSDLAHDAIIALYVAWKDRAYVYLALEWAPGGDVYSYLKSQRGRLAEELAVPLILEPFMAGLAVIHDRGLIHRDIKPENMLLTNSFQVKIADFGLSIDSKQEIANTRLGTIDYLAPEILDCPVKQHPEDHKDRPDTGYTNKVDCWSVGVLAYELLVGQPPFAAPSAQETLRLIRTKKVEYPAWLSPESVNFMSSVLVRDPTQRPSIAALLDHPWILKYSRREGGGLARGRTRLQQRRPTMDGGMLVRSITTDLASMHAAQKQHQQLAFHNQQQHLQQQKTDATGPPGPSTSQPHPHAHQHTTTFGQTPALSQPHGHGFGLGHAQASTGTTGGGMYGQLTQPYSLPLTSFHGPAPGGSASPGAGATAPAVASVNTAPMSYDATMVGAPSGAPALPPPSPGPLPLPQLLHPPTAVATITAPASSYSQPGGLTAPPGPGGAALDKNLGSFSRKFKFWSMNPGNTSSGGGSISVSGGAQTNDGAPLLPPPVPLQSSGGGGGGGATGSGGSGGPTPMDIGSNPPSPSAIRLQPLPPVTPPASSNSMASAAGNLQNPGIFSRLANPRRKSGAGATASGGSNSPPIASSSPPSAPTIKSLHGGMPPVTPGHAGGSTRMSHDGGSAEVTGNGGGGAGALSVPPLDPPPVSAAAMLRAAKGGSLHRHGL